MITTDMYQWYLYPTSSWRTWLSKLESNLCLASFLIETNPSGCWYLWFLPLTSLWFSSCFLCKFYTQTLHLNDFPNSDCTTMCIWCVYNVYMIKTILAASSVYQQSLKLIIKKSSFMWIMIRSYDGKKYVLNISISF